MFWGPLIIIWINLKNINGLFGGPLKSAVKFRFIHSQLTNWDPQKNFCFANILKTYQKISIVSNFAVAIMVRIFLFR
jgi:hypothetical protein